MHAKTMTTPFLEQRRYRARPLLVLSWRAIVDWWVQAGRHRAAADELRAMGELELRDLGVGRGEIDRLLQQHPQPRGRGPTLP